VVKVSINNKKGGVMSKKPDSELVSVSVTFICIKTGKEVTVNLTAPYYHAISSYESECELCGSHGYVDVSVTCPECKKVHDFSLKSW